MSARDKLIRALTHDSTGGLATEQDITSAAELVGARDAEVLREAAAALRKARRMGHLLLVSEEEFLEEMAEEGKGTSGGSQPSAGELTHQPGHEHTDSETAFMQIGAASWPRCATLILDGLPPLIGAYNGAGMRRAPGHDALIIEPMLLFANKPTAAGTGEGEAQ
ncbi:hypothetical protein ACIQPP_05345 [Streptomyces violaceusniger]|uniref:hypothetical protein n=1 Tax=Streptomyces violaceusniger TaxID=68280 RepID=UPI000997CF85|nr:hypothetical protein [Streptomyces hygroscopicus]AQW55246.1 hypothetical protein SHXM_08709 [Streptomyces hygroscopicus]